MAHDSVSAFFDALCVRMSFGDLYFPAETGLCQHRPSIINNGGSKILKTGIAAQSQGISDLIQEEPSPVSSLKDASSLRGVNSTQLWKIAYEKRDAKAHLFIQQDVNKAIFTRILAATTYKKRERTGKLHIKDLSNYFHLPISEAAKELRICSTALKKICRKHGMPRWPHRKIKSIDRRISNLLRDFCADDGLEALNIQVEIEQLRAQRAKICAGLQA
ncbi:Protein RKD5 [Platanthera zijinensis]|uniref:Protein RKD5 n=1 Tax=Platanthera zijinensis TaxID=2320716 RepID=A0AAP0GEY1_9ASPA